MRTIDACLRFFQDEQPRKKVSVTQPPSRVVVALRTPSLELKDQPLMAHPLGKRQSSRRRSVLGGAFFPPDSLFFTRRWAVLFMAPVAAVPFLIVVLRCPAFILYSPLPLRPAGGHRVLPTAPLTRRPRGVIILILAAILYIGFLKMYFSLMIIITPLVPHAPLKV